MAVFEKIYEKVIKDLNGLPSWITYHNAKHTQYVLQKAEEIAKEENLTGRDLLIIRIAALYHDTGFLIDRHEHEKISCQIFTEESKGYDFSAEERRAVCKIIMATRVPQQPENLLEKIVADADLEYLGTDDFDSFSNTLFHEILHYKPTLNKKEWDEIQVDFLSRHSYHTNYCKVNKEPQKQRNLEMVKERLLGKRV